MMDLVWRVALVATVAAFSLTEPAAAAVGKHHYGTGKAAADKKASAEKAKAAEPQEVDVEGAIDVVAGGKIHLKTAGGRAVIVIMHGLKTEVHVTGTASSDYLKSGMSVEFTADVNKNGQIDDDIVELRVYSASYGKPPAAAKTKPHDPGPAAATEPVAKEPAKDAPPEKAEETQPAPLLTSRNQPPGVFLIRGKINSLHSGKLSVATGTGAVVTGTLAADAKITVNVTDYALAAKGDHITVRGTGTPTAITAQSVQIEVLDTITGKKRGMSAPAPAEPSAK